MSNKPHELSLNTFALKGDNLDEIRNSVLENFNKLRSDGIITNDPGEYHKPHSKVNPPDEILMFYFYKTKEEV
jgi:hypothetical protein